MKESTVKTTLSAKSLQVDYNSLTALSIPELSLTGNTIAIIGHNGAGKSTLIKTVLQLLQPSSGSLISNVVAGEKSHLLIPEKHMAFCPESGSVFADIKVEAYIQLWCRIKCGNRNYYKKEGSEVIEALSLPPLLKRLGRELSKGQRRRVQTAIGFLTRPLLFLFDEPFCGLDVQKTRELKDYIEKRSSETSYLIASHRMEVVERLADKVIVLSRGRIRAAGTPEEVARDLCQQSIRIRGLQDLPRTVEQLNGLINGALITRFGSELFLSGKEVSEEKTAGVLQELGLYNESLFIESVEPTLVDALNYHLKDVENSDNSVRYC